MTLPLHPEPTQKLPCCLDLVGEHEQWGIIAHHVPEQSLVGTRRRDRKAIPIGEPHFHWPQQHLCPQVLCLKACHNAFLGMDRQDEPQWVSIAVRLRGERPVWHRKEMESYFRTHAAPFQRGIQKVGRHLQVELAPICSGHWLNFAFPLHT